MKLYRYKVEYNNKDIKTRFFDTRRQAFMFIKTHPQFKCSMFAKGMFGYNRIFTTKDF